jgi:hypothetical protein
MLRPLNVPVHHPLVIKIILKNLSSVLCHIDFSVNQSLHFGDNPCVSQDNGSNYFALLQGQYQMRLDM